MRVGCAFELLSQFTYIKLILLLRLRSTRPAPADSWRVARTNHRFARRPSSRTTWARQEHRGGGLLSTITRFRQKFPSQERVRLVKKRRRFQHFARGRRSSLTRKKNRRTAKRRRSTATSTDAFNGRAADAEFEYFSKLEAQVEKQLHKILSKLHNHAASPTTGWRSNISRRSWRTSCHATPRAPGGRGAPQAGRGRAEAWARLATRRSTGRAVGRRRRCLCVAPQTSSSTEPPARSADAPGGRMT